MRPSNPTFIVMKREIAGPALLDHGQTFESARKGMLHAENLDAGAPCPGPDVEKADSPPEKGYEAALIELKRIAGQLQAGIEALEAETGSAEGFKAAGDNPHGEKKVY